MEVISVLASICVLQLQLTLSAVHILTCHFSGEPKTGLCGLLIPRRAVYAVRRCLETASRGCGKL